MEDLIQKWAEDVVRWNEAAGKTTPFSNLSKSGQALLIEEEFKEILESIGTPFRLSNLVPEVCDFFVVSSFYYYMYTGKTSAGEVGDVRKLNKIFSDIESAIHEHHHILCYKLACEMIYNVSMYYDVKGVMEAKLRSNWSKIPTPRDLFSDIGIGSLDTLVEKECSRIVKNNKGRYLNVKGSFLDVNGDIRVVFKDINGKVVKPKTYKGWEEFYKDPECIDTEFSCTKK